MNTRARMMGLAALPLAGLLSAGVVALAQGAGTPASTQVVQQAAAHQAGDPYTVSTTTPQPCDQQRIRDRDRSCDHQSQPARTADRTMERARDGSCVSDASR